MNSPMFSRTSTQESAIQTNKVLRNTYALLSMTLLWSAVVAGFSMAMNLPRPGIIIMLVGFYGLLFMIEKNRNNGLGLGLTFVFTGFLGYTLGPILNAYVGAGMGDIVLTALGGTALSFIAASAYALTTKTRPINDGWPNAISICCTSCRYDCEHLHPVNSNEPSTKQLVHCVLYHGYSDDDSKHHSWR